MNYFNANAFVCTFFCIFYISQVSSLTWDTTLYVAADDLAVVWINGARYGHTRHLSKTFNVSITVKQGDIIEIETIDWAIKYGVIAALGKCVSKVGLGPWWVTVRGTNFPHPKLFRSIASNIVPPGSGSSGDFPYFTGAQYVWGDKNYVSYDPTLGRSSFWLRMDVTSACFN